MGDYATWNDVTGRYAKAATGADAEEMSNSFIAGVEAFMNSYLSKVYATPITNKPALLTDICVDLVYAKMTVHKDKASKIIRDNALAILKGIVDGSLLLTDGDGIVSSLGHAVWSSTEDYNDAFSMLGENDLIDPDLIEDLVNERS